MVVERGRDIDVRDEIGELVARLDQTIADLYRQLEEFPTPERGATDERGRP